MCGFIQDQDDQFDWTRKKGQTQSSNTGPLGDHTGGGKWWLRAMKDRESCLGQWRSFYGQPTQIETTTEKLSMQILCTWRRLVRPHEIKHQDLYTLHVVYIGVFPRNLLRAPCWIFEFMVIFTEHARWIFNLPCCIFLSIFSDYDHRYFYTCNIPSCATHRLLRVHRDFLSSPTWR